MSFIEGVNYSVQWHPKMQKNPNATKSFWEILLVKLGSTSQNSKENKSLKFSFKKKCTYFLYFLYAFDIFH